MDPFFREPTSMKESIETFFLALYGLAELQSMRKNGATSEPKACPACVSLITELGSLVKGWDIVAEDLLERNNCTVQLWTDKKSRAKVLVCLQEICPRRYLPAFFVPVPAGEDITEILADVARRISAGTIHEEQLSAPP